MSAWSNGLIAWVGKTIARVEDTSIRHKEKLFSFKKKKLPKSFFYFANGQYGHFSVSGSSLNKQQVVRL